MSFVLSRDLTTHTNLPGEGSVVDVTRDDGTSFRGFIMGYERVRGVHSRDFSQAFGRACVIPLGEFVPEKDAYTGSLPEQYLVPLDWKVERTPKHTDDDFDTWAQTHPAKPVRKSARRSMSKPPRITPGSKNMLGARVIHPDHPGEWVVVSLAPGPGRVHLQADSEECTSAFVPSVRSRELQMVGSAFETEAERASLFEMDDAA